MPNKCAITKILESSYKEMRPWDKRNLTTGKYAQVKKNIVRILNLISGSKPILMLKNILNSNEKKEIMDEKYHKALLNFSEIYNQTKFKKKHPFLRALKVAGFTKEESEALGFRCGKKLWKSCSDKKDRNLGGRPIIRKDLVMAVNEHMMNISQEASNRTIIAKDCFKNKKIETVRYCNVSWLEAYFCFEYRDELSFSTFYKYVEKIYKKPHRKTDLCHYCHEGKKLKNEIIRFCSEYHYIYEYSPNNLSVCLNNYFDVDMNDINCSKLIQYFLNLRNQAHKVLANSSNEISTFDKRNIDIFNDILYKLKNYYEIQVHKCIANGQRNIYNSNRTDIELLRNAIVIEIDFKQKIVIGSGPEQIGSQYYEHIQKTFLGFGIYHKDSNNEVNCINFDLVSDNQQDASNVVQSFRFMRKQEWFQQIDKKKYFIWTDLGKHFRCSQFLGYLMVELAKEGINVSLNHFNECHGKNQRDSHFSIITNMIHRESLQRQLTNSQDIVDAINKRQAQVNLYRKEIGLKPIDVIINSFVSPPTDEFIFLEMNDIENYYNFETNIEDFKIITKVFSFLSEKYELKFEITNKTHTSIVVERHVKEPESKLHILRERREKLNKDKKVYSIIKSLPYDFNYYDSQTNDSQARKKLIKHKRLNYLKKKPEFCIDKTNIKKNKKLCLNCNAEAKYHEQDLNQLNKKIIEEELEAHGHNKYRSTESNEKKRQRNKEEAKNELESHYLYAHDKN